MSEAKLVSEKKSSMAARMFRAAAVLTLYLAAYMALGLLLGLLTHAIGPSVVAMGCIGAVVGIVIAVLTVRNPNGTWGWAYQTRRVVLPVPEATLHDQLIAILQEIKLQIVRDDRARRIITVRAGDRGIIASTRVTSIEYHPSGSGAVVTITTKPINNSNLALLAFDGGYAERVVGEIIGKLHQDVVQSHPSA